MKLPDGGSVTAEAGHSAQDWSDSDDEPPSLIEFSSDSDSGEDSSDSEYTGFYNVVHNPNRRRHDHYARTEAVHEAAPGIPSPNNGSWSRDDTTESGWTVVGKINPQPIKLSPKGISDIFYYLSQVEMAPSARKAVTGDGICIGLTFKSSPFVHPKTARSRDLIEAIVAEVRSHTELKNIAFTSIQINHNTTSAPHRQQPGWHPIDCHRARRLQWRAIAPRRRLTTPKH